MKKLYFLIVLVLLAVAFIFVKCAKVNKDQPCGPYNNTNQQLYKDDSEKCYYIDNSTGEKVYVDRSFCNC